MQHTRQLLKSVSLLCHLFWRTVPGQSGAVRHSTRPRSRLCKTSRSKYRASIHDEKLTVQHNVPFNGTLSSSKLQSRNDGSHKGTSQHAESSHATALLSPPCNGIVELSEHTYRPPILNICSAWQCKTRLNCLRLLS